VFSITLRRRTWGRTRRRGRRRKKRIFNVGGVLVLSNPPASISFIDGTGINPLPPGAGGSELRPPPDTLNVTSNQGLTLVHYSARRKHILWDTLGA
jgi:hypothetical protein